jgi:hypothetical protein
LLAPVLALALAAEPASAPASGRDASPPVQLADAATGEVPVPKPPEKEAVPPVGTAEMGPYQLRIAAVPLISYGSTIGLQLGGALLFYKAPQGGGARRDWIVLGGSYATRGPRSIEVKGEQFDVLKTPMRGFYQVKYSADSLAPYWGEGAHLAPGDQAGAGTPPPAYRYRAVGPWISLVARQPVSGPWSAFQRVRFQHIDVSEPGAALDAARPPGFAGGTLTMLHAGALRDTRDEEVSPSHGTYLDASVFGAPPLLGTNTMWGFNGGVRGYMPLARGVVLAGRAMYELKAGDVPFYERTQMEGIGYGEGLGGPGTIRGVARARIAGEEKILANVEVRATLVTLRPGGRPLELGVSGGADAGRARQRGYTPVGAVAAFGGLRTIWDRALVLRLEAGYAGQGGAAYYLSFDESF